MRTTRKSFAKEYSATKFRARITYWRWAALGLWGVSAPLTVSGLHQVGKANRDLRALDAERIAWQAARFEFPIAETRSTDLRVLVDVGSTKVVRLNVAW